jgi:hypothetical protein
MIFLLKMIIIFDKILIEDENYSQVHVSLQKGGDNNGMVIDSVYCSSVWLHDEVCFI